MKRRRDKIVRALRMVRVYENWPTAVRNRLQLRESGRAEVVYRLREGPVLTVAAGPHDVRIVNEVWSDRIYELCDGFSIGDCWQIVDLGANKGSFSVLAASCARRGRIVAVEPIGDNVTLLLENIERNNLENIEVVRCAVGAESGQIDLQFNPAASGAASTQPQAGAEVVTAAVVTLSDILARFPGQIDLIKMDVEGAELEVLESASTSLLGRIRRLVLEYHDVASTSSETVGAALETRLRKTGFHVEVIPERRLIFASRGSEEEPWKGTE